jgi:CBS domain-containing protein
MKVVSQIMTRGVRAVKPSDSVIRAAQAMEELNVGALPVCDAERVVGMLTDRDIAVRGVAQGLADQDAKVHEIMTREVKWCMAEESVEDVLRVMSIHQIRRMPVVDRQHQLVGMISLGDIATQVHGAHVAEALHEISETEAVHRAGMLPVKLNDGDGAAANRAGRQSL